MIHAAVRTTAVCLSIVVVIGYSFPLFLVAAFPIGLFYLRVMKYVELMVKFERDIEFL
jgi:ATP-binding cassette subfamily C (CFTR/MRP) protein 1